MYSPVVSPCASIGILSAVLLVSACQDHAPVAPLDAGFDGPTDAPANEARALDTGSDRASGDGDSDASDERDMGGSDPGDAHSGDDGPGASDTGSGDDVPGATDAIGGHDGPSAGDALPFADGPPDGMPVVVPNPAAIKILRGGTDLLGAAQTGCTFGPGGDRWCAVSLPVTLTRRELWFVNATRLGAMNMSLSSCPTAGLCVRLADTLYTARPSAGPIYPQDVARASGNTFTYLRDAISGPSDPFQGDVWVHTIGAPQATKIGENVFDCTVAGQRYIDGGRRLINKVVGVCATEPASDDGAEVSFFSLTGGVVAGQDVPLPPSNTAPLENQTGPFAKVATVFPVHPQTQALRWRMGFSADGETLVLSNGGATLAEVEKIQTIRTDDIGKPGVAPTLMPGGENATRWTLSADGKKIYYLKEYNYNAMGYQSGTLWVADFPSGFNARELRSGRVPSGSMSGIGSYRLLVDQAGVDSGVGILSGLQAGRGSYAIIKDTAGDLESPANVVTVVQNARTLPLPSPKLDFSLFSKELSMETPTSDIWIRRNDGSGECLLTSGLLGGIFGVPFSESAGLVFWADNYDPATLSGEGWLTEPGDCLNNGKKKQFARNVDFWFVDRDRLLLYSDESDGTRVSLRYAVMSGNTLGPPVTIQTGADRFYQIVLDEQPVDGTPPRFKAVIYTLSGRADDIDGVYYYPLPAP